MSEAVITVFCGRQGAGKTFFFERLIRPIKRTVIVYNYGKLSDWKSYHVVFLDWDNKVKTLFFIYKNKRYKFAAEFMKLFRGKRVKIRRVKKTEQQAFDEMVECLNDPHLNFKNLLFIVDDASSLLKYRLTYAAANLVTQSKHNNTWMIFMYHQLGYIPNELLGHLTHLYLFQTTVFPSLQKQSRIPCLHLVKNRWKWLLKAPIHSYAILDTHKQTMQKHPFKK